MTLAATIDLSRAGRERWQAIVVGAGPAGSIAARQLARSGLRTLLVERKTFPRDKVCGACVNGRALAALRLLGLDDAVNRLQPVPLRRFQVRCGAMRTEIPLPAGVAVSRAAFDTELARAAIAAGAEFLPKTSALLIDDQSVDPELVVGRVEAAAKTGVFRKPDRSTENTLLSLQCSPVAVTRHCVTACCTHPTFLIDDEPVESGRRVELVQQGRAPVRAIANVVLLADGLGNPGLSRQHGLRCLASAHSRIGVGGVVADCPSGFEAGTIYMAVGRAGYVGMVRLADGRLNVAAALNPAALNRHERPAAVIASLLESARYPAIASLESAEWSGTVPLTRGSTHLAERRVLLLGDASGYVEPFTGDGIACALTSGAAAAALVARSGGEWNDGIGRHWSQMHRQLFDGRQQWCRRLAWLSRHPWAVRSVMRAVSFAPRLARPIIGRLNESPQNLFESAPEIAFHQKPAGPTGHPVRREPEYIA